MGIGSREPHTVFSTRSTPLRKLTKKDPPLINDSYEQLLMDIEMEESKDKEISAWKTKITTGSIMTGLDGIFTKFGIQCRVYGERSGYLEFTEPAPLCGAITLATQPSNCNRIISIFTSTETRFFVVMDGTDISNLIRFIFQFLQRRLQNTGFLRPPLRTAKVLFEQLKDPGEATTPLVLETIAALRDHRGVDAIYNITKALGFMPRFSLTQKAFTFAQYGLDTIVIRRADQPNAAKDGMRIKHGSVYVQVFSVNVYHSIWNVKPKIKPECQPEGQPIVKPEEEPEEEQEEQPDAQYEYNPLDDEELNTLLSKLLLLKTNTLSRILHIYSEAPNTPVEESTPATEPEGLISETQDVEAISTAEAEGLVSETQKVEAISTVEVEDLFPSKCTCARVFCRSRKKARISMRIKASHRIAAMRYEGQLVLVPKDTRLPLDVHRHFGGCHHGESIPSSLRTTSVPPLNPSIEPLRQVVEGGLFHWIPNLPSEQPACVELTKAGERGSNFVRLSLFPLPLPIPKTIEAGFAGQEPGDRKLGSVRKLRERGSRLFNGIVAMGRKVFKKESHRSRRTK
ncbi:hypothetical protein M501DRAFT_1012815 [Patellaria atrata CBS 101060]|uniref:Uncharacterized protein n=1 Tax=Patellaria atrata CBS 101060 TaxID=1346257 RepID=A0A9P4VX59_9PEZI|nr:hypothetical protein M501DRAFT_1012815 [Patellaria atrata CBS 101060]